MGKYLFLSLFMAINLGFGQPQQQQDTIEVAKNYKTLLFFDTSIIDTSLGNDLDFIMFGSGSQENNSKFSERIVKLTQNIASKKNDIYTNLTVITDDGNSFDFVLKSVKKPKITNIKVGSNNADYSFEKKHQYQDDLPLFDSNDEIKKVEQEAHQYSLESNTQINNDTVINKMENAFEKNKYDNLYDSDKEEYYRLSCYYHQFDNGKIARYFSRNGDVFLWLKNIYYNRNELYFEFIIDNKQSIDLDVEFINYLLATNYKKSSSNQETLLKPVYKYKQPQSVKGNTENHFVIVFSKFTLDKKMVFRVDLKEKNGARTMVLDIEPELVNNPERF